MPTETQYDFEWIENEELLRDEAVIFGLSDGDMTLKKEVIRSYFEEKITNASINQQIATEKKSRLEQEAAEIKQKYEANIDKEELLSVKTPPVETFKARLLAGSITYLLTSILSFVWLYEWLAPYWKYPIWVTIGVYLFGMFSFWGNVSILHSDTSESLRSWRKWVEELGIPFVSAFFVVAWGLTERPVLHSIVIFVLSFFLFAFVGKGLLGHLARWESTLKQQEANRRDETWRTAELQRIAQEIPIQKTHLQELNLEIENLYKILSTMEFPAIIAARREVALHLFESEAQLARSTKVTASPQKVQTIRQSVRNIEKTENTTM